jgi:hypothetical protein
MKTLLSFFALLLIYVYATSNLNATFFVSLIIGLPTLFMWLCYQLEKIEKKHKN